MTAAAVPSNAKVLFSVIRCLLLPLCSSLCFSLVLWCGLLCRVWSCNHLIKVKSYWWLQLLPILRPSFFVVNSLFVVAALCSSLCFSSVLWCALLCRFCSCNHLIIESRWLLYFWLALAVVNISVLWCLDLTTSKSRVRSFAIKIYLSPTAASAAAHSVAVVLLLSLFIAAPIGCGVWC